MGMNGLHTWMYTILFGVPAVLIIGNNVWHFIESKIKRETTSYTVFIGAFFGVIACLAAPIQPIKWLSFMPILLDPGSGLVIYAMLKNNNRNE
jgi:hypothetical protein